MSQMIRLVAALSKRKVLVLGGLVLLVSLGVLAAALSRSDHRDEARASEARVAQPLPATAAIVDEFESHPIVAVGESHDLQEAGRLYRALVTDPRFTRRVHLVVVEFGSARYQRLLDDYVAGKDVSLSRLRRVWQDTTQVGAWDAPMYAAFFAAVRTANARLPRSRQVRVLLGDPPIDWSHVRFQSQWQAIARSREAFMASIVEREVLAKGRQALVIAGLAHLTHGGGGVSDLVESHHPNAVFVAAVHVGFPSEALERRLSAWPAPSIARLEGTWIGALPFGDRHAQDSLDGLLYLGSPASLHLSVPLPTVYRDDRYWHELRARFQIVNGAPFSAGALFAPYSSPPYPSQFDPSEIGRARRFTQCMHSNGVETFPEPEVQFDAYGFFGKAIESARKDPDFKAAQRVCAKRIFGLSPPGG